MRGGNAVEGEGTSRAWRLRKGLSNMSANRVLVLEDSLIIAMEAEDILRAIGVETIRICSSIAQATEAVEAERFDFALLDVNLGEVMSFDFARRLVAENIPFGFVSGYSDTLDFPEELQNRPLLVKPFDETAMLEFLQRLFPAEV
ncbi:response regulator [Rhizobium grahamii]|uniref:response regulator n=1 Tax=Rhizobium sp. BG6 TaxID=2613771 RepID=UPI0032B28E9D